MSKLPPFGKNAGRVFGAAAIGALVPIALALAIRPGAGAQPDAFEFLGRFHTLALHLPIGVLLLVATAEAATLVPKLRPRIDPGIGLALVFFVATAIAAFTLGLLLAHGGGYPSKLVMFHRGFTLAAIVASVACTVAWWMRDVDAGNDHRALYRVLLGGTVALLTLGAHFGGSLTHGEDYLFRFAPSFVQKMAGIEVEAAKPIEPKAPSVEPLVFADVVLPIFRAHCIDCHGPDKSKGNLRLDSFPAVMKGGEKGAEVVAGRADASTLVKRMKLPKTDDDRMPPDDKAGPSAEEIAAIAWWIDRGASETLRVRDAIAPDDARSVLARSIPGASAPARTNDGTPTPTSPTLASANTPTDTAAHARDATSTPAAANVGAKLAWRDSVEPLLVARCGKCHANGRKKGGLRVDAIEALVAGGKSGAAIVPANASLGTLLARVHAPIADEKHMPPSDEAQLTSAQVELIAWWITHGADATTTADKIPARLVNAGNVAPARASPSRSSNAVSLDPPPITKTAPTSATSGAAAGPALRLYDGVVRPILARRCGECHSGDRAAAGLKIDDLQALKDDGEITPGNADDSTIVHRIALPLTDKHHMPPDAKPQVTPAELDAIKRWIAEGADTAATIPRGALPAELVASLGALPSSASPAASSSTDAATTVGAPDAGEAPREPAPASLTPTRGGCASCAIGNAGARAVTFAHFAAALAIACAFVTRRSRSRRRRYRC